MTIEHMTSQQYRAMLAKPSRQKGKSGRKMNATERRYRDDVLEREKAKGFVKEWRFQAVGLRLGNDRFYYPDFLVSTPAGMKWFVEVKGETKKDGDSIPYVMGDADIKMRWAANEFREFTFHIVWPSSLGWRDLWIEPDRSKE